MRSQRQSKLKHLLIVYHSKTGHTAQMAKAVFAGTQHADLEPVNVRMTTASNAAAEDLLWADGLLVGTPENFGYMSGAVKDFLDRTFYEVEGKISPLPYALFISAGNDGSGAVRAFERIAKGYPFTKVQQPVISIGEVDDQILALCEQLGMTMAAGIDLGVF
ncbi:MAG: flavodoxin [Gammaproteobacteria bacterium]|nr:flavodoxin [Gammaproteobacteria bacterium]